MAGTLQLTQEGILFIKILYELKNRPYYNEIKHAYNKMAKEQGWHIVRSDSTIRYYVRRLGIYKPVIKEVEIREQTAKYPRHGFINELAKLCGCSRHTVRTAIYENATGVKADFVRKVYRSRYVQPYESINN